MWWTVLFDRQCHKRPELDWCTKVQPYHPTITGDIDCTWPIVVDHLPSVLQMLSIAMHVDWYHHRHSNFQCEQYRIRLWDWFLVSVSEEREGVVTDVQWQQYPREESETPTTTLDHGQPRNRLDPDLHGVGNYRFSNPAAPVVHGAETILATTNHQHYSDAGDWQSSC
jgi:hypothetical protein